MSGAAKAVAVSVVAGGLAAAGTVLLLPWLKQADPLGLSPVVLITFLGGWVLGWYARGTTDTGKMPVPQGNGPGSVP